MRRLENVKIKARNLKCFSDEPAGFDTILPINLIIGRNNSGKSTLLDMIHYVTAPNQIALVGYRGRTPEVLITDALNEEELKGVFRHDTSGGPISGSHWEFGKQWVGRPLTWRLDPNGSRSFVSIDPPAERAKPTPSSISKVDEMLRNLAGVKADPFNSRLFRRLQSDRDIMPEEDTHGFAVKANGQGATTVIRHFITETAWPTELVKQVMLTELNSIFEPDSSFTEIDVQRYGGRWEVYLVEPNKGRIPLSQSGSGLKTILLVLVLLYLNTEMEHNQLNQYLFGFEELENNAHPALQRRLFTYLRRIALEEGCIFFISTHSNVVIDLFSSDEHAQILHVTHDGDKASVARAVTYVENSGILDDLDVRASDLLQSNCIVWVEGPSDRLYFKRWVDNWTGGELREGIHYQCVSYGGRLLAHLTAQAPGIDVNDLVQILRVNRNAILLIDSDRDKESDELNPTKQRLVSEIEGAGGIAWVTAGRAIENYLPLEALRRHYSVDSLEPPKPFQTFPDYLEQIKRNEGTHFLRNKPLYAELFAPHMTKENLAETLDLSVRLDAICHQIRRWNGLIP